MFGFSRKRMKLGRVKKVQLSDSAQGTRSPVRPLKKFDKTNSDYAAPRGDERSALDQSMASNNNNSTTSGSSESWIALSVAGDKPAPRSNHAASVIGNKMIVVGGESANGLLDDVKVLNFGNFTWTTASSKLYLSPSSLPLKIPACKGHCLVSWGKKALLVGGKTDPGNDRVTVWAFDTETECWSLIEAKGDIPVARSGHTVVRASSALILFGGEDAKRRKLNDLHVFDLKSFTWLPLHCTGTGPCPRANHVAALYDDQTLFIFGGSSKSKTLNDLYSLDFEKMLWSRIKVKGFHPSPRAGCCAVLCGTSWYIVGGGSKKKRHTETVIFDILKSEWSLPVASPPSSITSNKGFSLVLGQHKDKNFLVSFGGSRKEPSNQIEVHLVEKLESFMGPRSVPGKFEGHVQFGKRLPSSGLATNFGNGSSKQPVDSVARQSLASAVEHHGSVRKSLSELTLDHSPASGNVSLRKQFRDEEEYNAVVKFAKNSEDEHLGLQGIEQRTNQSAGVQPNPAAAKISSEDPTSHESEASFPRIEGIRSIPMENDHFAFSDNEWKLGGISAPSSIHQYYETKMAELIRKNGILEGQLVAAQASREVTEKHLSAAVRGRQEMEKKFTDTVKEMEMLKEKLAGIELAQEEAHSMSDIVHSDNVRLEHDVAFLKAVLEDTQKELHSTRGVLAGERARAFQLQVEVFHLKQRLQSLESRAPTPRKPFPV